MTIQDFKNVKLEVEGVNTEYKRGNITASSSVIPELTQEIIENLREQFKQNTNGIFLVTQVAKAFKVTPAKVNTLLEQSGNYHTCIMSGLLVDKRKTTSLTVAGHRGKQRVSLAWLESTLNTTFTYFEGEWAAHANVKPIHPEDIEAGWNETAGILIRNYTFNPLKILKFRHHTKAKDMQDNGGSELFMGVEYEVGIARGVKKNVAANNTLHSLRRTYTVIKDDASVSGGFEIVTAPATMQVHKKRFEELFSDESVGLQTHDGAGIHIHLSRDFFGDQAHVSKFAHFINREENHQAIKSLARRGSQRFCQYNHNSDPDMPAFKFRDDRSVAVNLVNRNTVELRIFKGDYDKDHFFKCLEFTHALARFVKRTDKCHLRFGDFTKWLKEGKANAALYPTLFTYLEGRTNKETTDAEAKQILKDLDKPKHTMTTEQKITVEVLPRMMKEEKNRIEVAKLVLRRKQALGHCQPYDEVNVNGRY